MSKRPSVFYCTLSRLGSPAANAIQTRAMSAAFAHWAGRVCVTVRHGASSLAKQEDASLPYELFALPSGQTRMGGWLYSWRAFRLFQLLSSTSVFDVVFTRSLLFCVLVSLVRSDQTVLELHTGLRGVVDRCLLHWLSWRGTHFVCITHAISRELALALPGFARIHVAPDGHDFDVVDAGNVGPSDQRPMRVGYFGSLTKQKGLELLRALIERDLPIEFHIFSKETGVLSPHPSLRSYEYLAPNAVYARMLDMDVFLLTVVPQGKGDQISGYTSPLKLYEYLAAGRPILVSDLPVLREDVSDESVYFCDNVVEDFVKTLRNIDANRREARARAVNGLKVAHARTWKLRSRRILEICQAI